MAKPSGASPTTTLSITRGGFASMSITLTVSTWPSAAPLLPLSAVSASLPSGVTSTLYGHRPAGTSCLLYVTFSPFTSRKAILCPGNFAASARLPSGVNTTCATCSPIVTVSISSTFFPEMRSTLIEPSARFATSARLPARLIDMPEGCLPAVTVSISLGGFAVRSMTQIRLSGTCFQAPPSWATFIELATSARLSSGVMARLTGGPTMVFMSGRETRIFGASGSVPTSMIATESRPGGPMTALPDASQLCFSSRPTIISSRFPAAAGFIAAKPATATRIAATIRVLKGFTAGKSADMVSLSYELESRHGTPRSVRMGKLLRPVGAYRGARAAHRGRRHVQPSGFGNPQQSHWATSVLEPGERTLCYKPVVASDLPMAARKPKRISNSVNVILPKDMLARLKLEKGDAPRVTDTPDGVRHTPRNPRFAPQMKRVRRIAKKRRAVLRELGRW